jgi:hypothetical protein
MVSREGVLQVTLPQCHCHAHDGLPVSGQLILPTTDVPTVCGEASNGGHSELPWWRQDLTNDSTTLAARTVATRYETIIIGVSPRDEKSETFQNYFIDMASGSDCVSDEKLAPEETLRLWVCDQQEPML